MLLINKYKILDDSSMVKQYFELFYINQNNEK